MNIISLSGVIGDNIKMRPTVNGKQCVSFTLIEETPFKNKDGKHVTQFHRILAFDKLVQEFADNGVPGNKLIVEGKLNYRSYTDPKNSEKKTITQILVSRFDFMPEVNGARGVKAAGNEDCWDILGEEVAF